MPIIQFRINQLLNEEQKRQILLGSSQLVAAIMNKPVADVMVCCSCDDIAMGGQFGLAAFVDIRCLSDLTVPISRSICEGLYQLLHKLLCIDSTRLYIYFSEVSYAHAWRFINGTAVCSEDTM